jgi:xanthine dehydrogenase accessory factor
VLPDGSIDGFVGGVCAESTVRLEGLRLLRSGTSVLLRVTPSVGAEGAPEIQEGVRVVGNPCLSGGTLDIFLEAVLPPVLVHVLGESPVARAMVRVGEALRYEVRQAMDPGESLAPDTDAVIVAAHGRDEEPMLLAALSAQVPYIALVASPKRAAAVLGLLPVTAEAKQLISVPAGLDIGAHNPQRTRRPDRPI